MNEPERNDTSCCLCDQDPGTWTAIAHHIASDHAVKWICMGGLAMNGHKPFTLFVYDTTTPPRGEVRCLCGTWFYMDDGFAIHLREQGGMSAHFAAVILGRR